VVVPSDPTVVVVCVVSPRVVVVVETVTSVEVVVEVVLVVVVVVSLVLSSDTDDDSLSLEVDSGKVDVWTAVAASVTRSETLAIVGDGSEAVRRREGADSTTAV